MSTTLILVALGVGACGLILLKVGGRYFEHRGGSAKSVGTAGVLVGFAFLIVAPLVIWIVRIQHLLRR